MRIKEAKETKPRAVLLLNTRESAGVPVWYDQSSLMRIINKYLIHALANGYRDLYNCADLMTCGGWQKCLGVLSSDSLDCVLSDFTGIIRFKHVTGSNGILLRKTAGSLNGWQFQEQTGNTIVHTVYHNPGYTSISVVYGAGFPLADYDLIAYYNRTTKAMNIELWDISTNSILCFVTGASTLQMGLDYSASDLESLIKDKGHIMHYALFDHWLSSDNLQQVRNWWFAK